MDLVTNPLEDQQIKQEITLEDLARRLDVIGRQMDWLIENLQSLFQFVTAMGNSGGGIRGILKAMKTEAPQLGALEESDDAG